MPCDRRLLAREARGVQEIGELARGGLFVITEHDERDRDFAESLVKTSDDGGLADGGMAREQIFDVASGELLATTIDDIFEPPRDGDEPSPVDHTDVAGAKPPFLVQR